MLVHRWFVVLSSSYAAFLIRNTHRGYTRTILDERILCSARVSARMAVLIARQAEIRRGAPLPRRSADVSVTDCQVASCRVCYTISRIDRTLSVSRVCRLYFITLRCVTMKVLFSAERNALLTRLLAIRKSRSI